jgi:hypothetical protein
MTDHTTEKDASVETLHMWVRDRFATPDADRQASDPIRASDYVPCAREHADQPGYICIRPDGHPTCDHEWSERGSHGDRWQECWLCGLDRDIPPGKPSDQ